MELRVGPTSLGMGRGIQNWQIDLGDRALRNCVTIMRLLLDLVSKIRRN
jgi:hypothetical protein